MNLQTPTQKLFDALKMYDKANSTDDPESFTFKLYIHKHVAFRIVTPPYGYDDTFVMKLDPEDVEYFRAKYAKKLKQEYIDAMAEIKQKLENDEIGSIEF